MLEISPLFWARTRARLDVGREKAAEALLAQDRERDALQRFADLVEPLVAYALQSVHDVLGRIESGQALMQGVGIQLLTGQSDLEALMGQSLRAPECLRLDKMRCKR